MQADIKPNPAKGRAQPPVAKLGWVHPDQESANTMGRKWSSWPWRAVAYTWFALRARLQEHSQIDVQSRSQHGATDGEVPVRVNASYRDE